MKCVEIAKTGARAHELGNRHKCSNCALGQPKCIMQKPGSVLASASIYSSPLCKAVRTQPISPGGLLSKL